MLVQAKLNTKVSLHVDVRDVMGDTAYRYCYHISYYYTVVYHTNDVKY